MPRKVLLALFATALLVPLLVWAGGRGQAADPNDISGTAGFRNSVTVTGEGKIYAPSDEATILFGVRTVRNTASNAMSENSQVTAKAISTLRAQGLTEDEISTGNISLYPQQDFREGRAPHIISYTAENRVIVRTKKLDKLGAIIDSATKAGATDVSDLRFQLSEDNKAKQDALRIAIQNAKKKAEALAREMGVSVGSPITISEGIQTTPIVPLVNESRMALDVAGQAAPPVLPQDVQVNALVTVSFNMN